MKLTTATQEVRHSDPGHDRKFSMMASNKAFEILSGLYKDTVRAIIRELGTNAADSHVAANKRKVPFAVHLPTALEPFFYVKDFGTGLSDFQIRGGYECFCGHRESADLNQAPVCNNCHRGLMEFKQGIYTIYFASDKAHSDDYTGCLGLGSKSPFAYTEAFTVTSVCGGMKGVYTAYKEDGAPAISKLSLEPTTEPDGMEVNMPVKSSDFADFRLKAIDVYKWFNPRPMVSGLSVSDYGVDPILLENGNWAITKNNDTLSAMMGNICYEINFYSLDQSFEESLTEYEKWMAKDVGPLLKLSIGEVDITPSRESLKYTPKTHAAIKRRLNQVVQECLAEAERQIADCETFWEARIMLGDISESRWLKGLLPIGVRWHGKLIHTAINLKRDGVPRIGCRVYFMQKGRRDSRKIVSDETSQITAISTMAMFVNDMPTNFNGRIERYLRYKGTRLYIFHDIPGQSQTLAEFAKEEQIEHLIGKLSELEEAVVKPKVPPKKTAKILRYNDYGANQRVSQAWHETQIDNINEGEYVYVEVNGFEWSAGDLSERTISHWNQTREIGFAQPKQLGSKFGEMERFLPIGIKEIVGLRKSAVSQMAKLPNWTRLDVWLKKFCEEQKAMRLTTAKMILWQQLHSTVPQVILDLHGTKTLRPKNPVRQLRRIYKDLSKGNDRQVNACIKACEYAGVALPDLSTTKDEALNLLKVTLRRYPMLFMLEAQHHLREPHQQRKVVKYLRLIDDTRTPIQKAKPDKVPV